MKKAFLLFAVALSSLLLNAQTNQVVWLNGKVFYQQPIATIDSITFDMNNMIEGDTLKLILPHATQEIVYRDVIKEVHDTVYIYKCPDDDHGSSDVLAGAFSVAEGKQIAFSRGNLQYTQSTATWAFAEHQYDMIGTANVSDGTESYDATYGYSKDGTALADKIDLFGWSGSTGSAKWGISTSTDNSDYSGDFVDWGKNIGDGTTYRTLTNDEWNYLLNTRTNASEKKGVARIKLSETEYANGLILLPDSWTSPTDVTFKSGFAIAGSVQAYADYQIFTLDQWQKLEAAGAVFLPASGGRDGSGADLVQDYGYYWSATALDSYYAYFLLFYSNYAITNFLNNFRLYGRAVRLVQDL